MSRMTEISKFNIITLKLDTFDVPQSNCGFIAKVTIPNTGKTLQVCRIT